jgi:hypothetical protein
MQAAYAQLTKDQLIERLLAEETEKKHLLELIKLLKDQLASTNAVVEDSFFD